MRRTLLSFKRAGNLFFQIAVSFLYLQWTRAIPDSNDWFLLSEALSPDASLHGPIDPNDYDQKCRKLGTDAYAINAGGDGMCMHSHACSHKFCLPSKYSYNLPSYIAAVYTEEDIAVVLNFAKKHNISVTVKSTGHSYQGSSTAEGSLTIWMHKYPKDGSITKNYVDSCGNVTDAVVGINGGEVFDDMLEAVKDEYHYVTGGGRTVSASGGWLQGGGLSFSSREYGIGVDQVVDFRVVLADGSVVLADACTNKDLFWALKGGGGGTYGVVTNVHYKLHPKTDIVQVNWFLWGLDRAIQAGRSGAVLKAIDQWLEYWIKVSPSLDSRWSGFFSSIGAHLLFAGNIDDAKKTFINSFDLWYDNVLDKSQFNPFIWGASRPSSSFNIFDSWYDYKGGPFAANNPGATDATGVAYDGIAPTASRLMPHNVVVERASEVKDLLIDLTLNDEMGYINYFLGGNINQVSTTDTAVHPALRKSIWSLFTTTDSGADKVRNFVPNDVTGVCFNHHNGIEPDWRNACWGSNYARLEEIKAKYDPSGVFQCWHCVGYQGEEFPPIRTELPSLSPTPLPTMIPTTMPVRNVQLCTDVHWKQFQFWKTRKTCFWLSRLSSRNRNKFCTNLKQVRNKCPDTCDGLCFCTDKAWKKFQFWKSTKKCSFLQNLSSENRNSFCKKLKAAREACPDTCRGWCSRK